MEEKTMNLAVATVAADLTNTQGGMFTTVDTTTQEGKATLYNAMQQPDKQLADCINESIELTDVFVEEIELINDETGEVNTAPHTVLIDANGVSYSCVSKGVYNSLKRLFMIFGLPNTWETPLIVKISQVNKGNNRILTLNLVR